MHTCPHWTHTVYSFTVNVFPVHFIQRQTIELTINKYQSRIQYKMNRINIFFLKSSWKLFSFFCFYIFEQWLLEHPNFSLADFWPLGPRRRSCWRMLMFCRRLTTPSLRTSHPGWLLHPTAHQKTSAADLHRHTRQHCSKTHIWAQ